MSAINPNQHQHHNHPQQQAPPLNSANLLNPNTAAEHIPGTGIHNHTRHSIAWDPQQQQQRRKSSLSGNGFFIDYSCTRRRSFAPTHARQQQQYQCLRSQVSPVRWNRTTDHNYHLSGSSNPTSPSRNQSRASYSAAGSSSHYSNALPRASLFVPSAAARFEGSRKTSIFDPTGHSIGPQLLISSSGGPSCAGPGGGGFSSASGLRRKSTMVTGAGSLIPPTVMEPMSMLSSVSKNAMTKNGKCNLKKELAQHVPVIGCSPTSIQASLLALEETRRCEKLLKEYKRHQKRKEKRRKKREKRWLKIEDAEMEAAELANVKATGQGPIESTTGGSGSVAGLRRKSIRVIKDAAMLLNPKSQGRSRRRHRRHRQTRSENSNGLYNGENYDDCGDTGSLRDTFEELSSPSMSFGSSVSSLDNFDSATMDNEFEFYSRSQEEHASNLCRLNQDELFLDDNTLVNFNEAQASSANANATTRDTLNEAKNAGRKNSLYSKAMRKLASTLSSAPKQQQQQHLHQQPMPRASRGMSLAGGGLADSSYWYYHYYLRENSIDAIDDLPISSTNINSDTERRSRLHINYSLARTKILNYTADPVSRLASKLNDAAEQQCTNDTRASKQTNSSNNRNAFLGSFSQSSDVSIALSTSSMISLSTSFCDEDDEQELGGQSREVRPSRSSCQLQTPSQCNSNSPSFSGCSRAGPTTTSQQRSRDNSMRSLSIRSQSGSSSLSGSSSAHNSHFTRLSRLSGVSRISSVPGGSSSSPVTSTSSSSQFSPFTSANLSASSLSGSAANSSLQRSRAPGGGGGGGGGKLQEVRLHSRSALSVRETQAKGSFQRGGSGASDELDVGTNMEVRSRLSASSRIRGHSATLSYASRDEERQDGNREQSADQKGSSKSTTHRKRRRRHNQKYLVAESSESPKFNCSTRLEVNAADENELAMVNSMSMISKKSSSSSVPPKHRYRHSTGAASSALTIHDQHHHHQEYNKQNSHTNLTLSLPKESNHGMYQSKRSASFTNHTISIKSTPNDPTDGREDDEDDDFARFNRVYRGNSNRVAAAALRAAESAKQATPSISGTKAKEEREEGGNKRASFLLRLPLVGSGARRLAARDSKLRLSLKCTRRKDESPNNNLSLLDARHSRTTSMSWDALVVSNTCAEEISTRQQKQQVSSRQARTRCSLRQSNRSRKQAPELTAASSTSHLGASNYTLVGQRQLPRQELTPSSIKLTPFRDINQQHRERDDSVFSNTDREYNLSDQRLLDSDKQQQQQRKQYQADLKDSLVSFYDQNRASAQQVDWNSNLTHYESQQLHVRARSQTSIPNLDPKYAPPPLTAPTFRHNQHQLQLHPHQQQEPDRWLLSPSPDDGLVQAIDPASSSASSQRSTSFLNAPPVCHHYIANGSGSSGNISNGIDLASRILPDDYNNPIADREEGLIGSQDFRVAATMVDGREGGRAQMCSQQDGGDMRARAYSTGARRSDVSFAGLFQVHHDHSHGGDGTGQRPQAQQHYNFFPQQHRSEELVVVSKMPHVNIQRSSSSSTRSRQQQANNNNNNNTRDILVQYPDLDNAMISTQSARNEESQANTRACETEARVRSRGQQLEIADGQNNGQSFHAHEKGNENNFSSYDENESDMQKLEQQQQQQQQQIHQGAGHLDEEREKGGEENEELGEEQGAENECEEEEQEKKVTSLLRKSSFTCMLIGSRQCGKRTIVKCFVKLLNEFRLAVEEYRKEKLLSKLVDCSNRLQSLQQQQEEAARLEAAEMRRKSSVAFGHHHHHHHHHHNQLPRGSRINSWLGTGTVNRLLNFPSLSKSRRLNSVVSSIHHIGLNNQDQLHQHQQHVMRQQQQQQQQRRHTTFDPTPKLGPQILRPSGNQKHLTVAGSDITPPGRLLSSCNNKSDFDISYSGQDACKSSNVDIGSFTSGGNNQLLVPSNSSCLSLNQRRSTTFESGEVGGDTSNNRSSSLRRSTQLLSPQDITTSPAEESTRHESSPIARARFQSVQIGGSRRRPTFSLKELNKRRIKIRFRTRRQLNERILKQATSKAKPGEKQDDTELKNKKSTINDGLGRPCSEEFPDIFMITYAINDRDSYEYAKIAISQLRSIKLDSPAPIVLVANKIDLERAKVVKSEEARVFARRNACKYMEISCTIGFNLDNLLVGVRTQLVLKHHVVLNATLRYGRSLRLGPDGRRESQAPGGRTKLGSNPVKVAEQQKEERGGRHKKVSSAANDNILIRFYKRYVVDNYEQNYDCDNFSKL